MIDAYVALLTFILFMVATPGPANLIVMIGGAQRGVLACLGFIVGLACGKLMLNIAFGLGFGLFLADQPIVVNVLKFGSAGYMIWLALQSWNNNGGAGQAHNPYSFWTGVIVHPLNPKAWVMVVLAWSQFAPALGSFWLQFLLVASGFAVIQLVFHTLWCAGGALLQRAVPNSQWLTRGMVVLTLIIVLLALTYDSEAVKLVTASLPIEPRYLKLNVSLNSSPLEISRSLVASRE